MTLLRTAFERAISGVHKLLCIGQVPTPLSWLSVVLAAVHGLFGLCGSERADEPLTLSPLTSPLPFPVPNKPSGFCGRRTTGLHSYNNKTSFCCQPLNQPRRELTLLQTLTNRLRPDDGVGYSWAVTGVVVRFQVVDDAGDGLWGFLGRRFRFRCQVETPQDLSLQLLYLVQLRVILKHARYSHPLGSNSCMWLLKHARGIYKPVATLSSPQ